MPKRRTTRRITAALALCAAIAMTAAPASAQPSAATPRAASASGMEEAKRIHAEAVELHKAGKHAEAVEAMKRALAAVEKAAGKESIPAANVHEDLAELYMSVDVKKAAPLYERCIVILEKKLGKTHVALAGPLNNLSLAYETMGRMPQAVEAASRAIAIREQGLGPDHDQTMRSVANLMAIYSRASDFKRAVPLCERLVSSFEKTLGPDHPVVADQIEVLAKLHYGDKDLAGAVKLLDRALVIRDKAMGPENPELLDFIDTLASLHAQNGAFERSFELARRALGIRERKFGVDALEVAGSLSLLSKLKGELGDSREALSLLERALTILEKTHGKDSPKIAPTLNALAILHIERAGFDRAVAHLTRAIALYEREVPKNEGNISASLNNLAEVYLRRGDLRRAESLQERALVLLEKAVGPDHEDVAVLLNNMAASAVERGDYARGIPLLSRALSIHEKRLGPTHTDVAAAAGNLGEVYLRMQDTARAEPLLTRAAAIREAAHGPDHPLVANSLNNLGSLLSQKGDFKRAETLFSRAVAIYEKAFGKEHPAIAAPLTNLALIYQDRGEFNRVEASLNRVIAIQEGALGAMHPALALSHRHLGSYYRMKGDLVRAVAEQEKAEEINERHLGLLIATGSEEQKLALMATLANATNTTLSTHLMSARENEAAARLAMTTILRRKGRVLDAMVDSQSALRSRLKPEDQALLDDLASARSALAKALLRAPGEGEGAPAGASISITAIEKEVRRLEVAVSAKSAEFRVQSEPVTVEKIQSLLPEDTALLELTMYRQVGSDAAGSGDHYAAYVLRRTGAPKAVDLGPAAAIDDKVRALREALSNPERTDVRSIGRALDELVMRPIRPILAGARVLAISPDSSLNLIPFGALVDEDGRFLIERASVYYLTSGRDLLRRELRAPSRQGPVILANPRFDAQGDGAVKGDGEASRAGELTRLARARFTPLPGTAEEAEALREVLTKPVVRTGTDATKAILRTLHGPSILHIATHGFFLDDQAKSAGGRGLELEANAPLPAAPPSEATNTKNADSNTINLPNNPLVRSGLALAGANADLTTRADGILTALEASALDLYGTDLVVLSACETGIGSTRVGDGVYGLRRAFVIAGAETQVMSLWKVDDAATRDLMIAFYTELRRGGARSESMHKVQLGMLGRKEAAHPYFWASFIVSGNPEPLPSQSAPSVSPTPPGPRGCACEAAGGRSSSPAGGPIALLAALAVLAPLARRRRRAPYQNEIEGAATLRAPSSARSSCSLNS